MAIMVGRCRDKDISIPSMYTPLVDGILALLWMGADYVCKKQVQRTKEEMNQAVGLAAYIPDLGLASQAGDMGVSMGMLGSLMSLGSEV